MKRTGAKNRPQWRIVVADIKSPRDGRFIEEIGYYNPLPIEETIEIKKERLEYWVKQGAQLSGSVKSLLQRLKRTTAKQAA